MADSPDAPQPIPFAKLPEMCALLGEPYGMSGLEKAARRGDLRVTFYGGRRFVDVESFKVFMAGRAARRSRKKKAAGV